LSERSWVRSIHVAFYFLLTCAPIPFNLKLIPHFCSWVMRVEMQRDGTFERFAKLHEAQVVHAHEVLPFR
jgi:hypothetical protein